MTSNPRRLWILSDLHTDSADFTLPANPDADILVIAGDIGGRLAGQGRLWLERHLPRDIPCILAPGNHDYYGGDIDDEFGKFQRKTDLENLHVLDGSSIVIGGIRFAGGTLWTDYGCYSDAYTAQHAGLSTMTDFDRIQHGRHGASIRPSGSRCGSSRRQ